MNRKLSFGLLVLPAVLFSINLLAQNKEITLEDIYTNGLYRSKGIGQLRWMKDNKSYSTLEFNATAKGNDLVRYDVASGTKSVLVNANLLMPAGTNKPLAIDDYIWSEDNNKLLIFTNTRKVWRYNTRGDYWVLDLANGKLKQLGKGLEEATLMFAKFSPDGGRVAYVSKLNIMQKILLQEKLYS